VLAAALSAGDGFVVSHATAAVIWNLRHSDKDWAGLHVSGDRRVRIIGVTAHRVGLTSDERDSCGLVPVTSVERTIADLAGTLSQQQLGQCVDDAVRRRLAKLERLRTLVELMPARRGQPSLSPLQQILAERVAGYRPDDSDFEAKMNRLWDELGLPPARRQHRVTVGGHNYRLDRAIAECKICVEWDSDRYHSAPSDREYDSNRRARLVAAGWLVIPVTGKSRPELIAAAVLRAYEDRGGAEGDRFAV
jgi:very-short-patch-repair endonuclease